MTHYKTGISTAKQQEVGWVGVEVDDKEANKSIILYNPINR